MDAWWDIIQYKNFKRFFYISHGCLLITATGFARYMKSHYDLDEPELGKIPPVVE